MASYGPEARLTAGRSGPGRPLVRATGLRLRELSRRTVVVGLFVLEAALVLGFQLVAAYGSRRPVPDRSVLLRGLHGAAAPGGLLFGVLATVIVGTELASGIERVLLARDPRRSRLVCLELAVVLVTGVVWVLVEGAFAIAAGALLHVLGGAGPLLGGGGGLVARALAGLAFATLAYGLLGAACAFLLRGAVAGVVGLLVYGVLVELALAPLWHPATRWTVFDAAGALTTGTSTAAARAALVLSVTVVVSAVVCFASYAGREIRD